MENATGKIDRISLVRLALQREEDRRFQENIWIMKLEPFKYPKLDNVGLWLLGSHFHTVNPQENVIIDSFSSHLISCLNPQEDASGQRVVEEQIRTVKKVLNKLAWPIIDKVSVLQNADNSITVGDLKAFGADEIGSLGVTKTEMAILWRLFFLED